MLHNEEILIENIKKKGNKVLIWGACERNNDILDFFKHNDVNVVGYIDQNSDKQNTYNDFPVFSKDIIKDNNYFVYVGLMKTYNEVISYLENNNYTEFTDYWYPYREIKLDGSCSYGDLYGNEYVGENYNIQVKLSNGGKIIIGSKCKFNNLLITALNMSEIRINNKVNLRGLVNIFADYNSVIDIYENVTSYTNLYIVSVQNSKIIMGKDCMLSRDIIIRAGNSHNIFNLETGENLTSIGRSIVIGDHVWIGHRATLFSGCEIGNGSIIGINTFVNKKFPANCSIAGNPAKIIKENVAWRRESYPYFDSYENFADFDFR